VKRALRRKTKPGMASRSLTRRYMSALLGKGSRRSHETGLNCITVGLDGVRQGLQEPGEATVRSPKHGALVQADTRDKNEKADLLQTGPVVRVSRPIWDSEASV
jgi:hypothetical protein